MNLPVLASILIASIAVAACGGSKIERPAVAYGCPASDDKKVNSKEDLIKSKLEIAGSLPNIDVVDLRCSERASGLRIDVDLKNDSNEERRIAYRFRWLDKEGMRAWDDESWKPLLIYGKTLYTVTTMSPAQEAVDFRVVIMDQDK
ncbi:MAG TPA: YcfL family protein [Burkholderiales bacterium]|nr:YcfL family protein [Burkholderiales bacterium]